MFNINPRVSDFLKQKPDITVVGLIWAGWWRLYTLIFGIYIIIMIVILLLSAIADL
jgi:hypothetical protein